MPIKSRFRTQAVPTIPEQLAYIFDKTAPIGTVFDKQAYHATIYPLACNTRAFFDGTPFFILPALSINMPYSYIVIGHILFRVCRKTSVLDQPSIRLFTDTDEERCSAVKVLMARTYKEVHNVPPYRGS